MNDSNLDNSDPDLRNPNFSSPDESNPIRSQLKTADIIGGTVAVLLAIPNLTVEDGWSLEKMILVLLIVAAIPTGW